jgi:hypothetical protein
MVAAPLSEKSPKLLAGRFEEPLGGGHERLRSGQKLLAARDGELHPDVVVGNDPLLQASRRARPYSAGNSPDRTNSRLNSAMTAPCLDNASPRDNKRASAA